MTLSQYDIRYTIELARPLLVCLILTFLIPGTSSGQFGPKGTCRAVVVGISEYQDPDIPDLRFAHRDARAFADYLLTRPADKVKAEDLKLLVNEQATGGNVHSAMRSLVKDSQAGDKVVIYFAGHGDVETLFPDEPGHLLVYDTPANNYSSNSLRLDDVRRTVNALVNRDIQVLIVTDACHAGKLAGSSVNGAQAATSSMAEQFNSEIKILSCQSNEFSQEGEQWGEGRGVFSWYLIQGLTGLADADNDLQVTIKELSRFLEDKIEPDVSPLSQTPNLVGDRNARVAVIDEEQLLALQKELDPNFTDTEEVIAAREPAAPIAVDTIWVAMTTDYQAALDQHRLLDIDLPSADGPELSAKSLLAKIKATYPDKKEVTELEDQLIANLQEGAQQAINGYLKSDQKELLARWKGSISVYQKYPVYLKTAAAMLGKDQYLQNRLLALAHYFQAIQLRLDSDKRLEPEQSLLHAARLQADSAKLLEPRSAFIPNELGLIAFRLNDLDGARKYYKEAIAIAPTWAMPYNNLGIIAADQGLLEEAGEWASQALQRDSSLFGSYTIRAKYHRDRQEDFLAEAAYLEAIKRNPTLPQPLVNYANYWVQQGRMETAEIWYQQVLVKTPVFLNDLAEIAEFYLKKPDYNRAIHYFRQVLQTDSSSSKVWTSLGRAYVGTNQVKEAITAFQTAHEIAPHNPETLTNLGWVSYINGEMEKSLEYYDRVIASQPDSIYCPALNGSGATLLSLGRLDEARDRLIKMISYCTKSEEISTALYNLTCVESLSGNTAEALRSLELALQSGFSHFAHIRSDPDLDALRTLPEFEVILHKYE